MQDGVDINKEIKQDICLVSKYLSTKCLNYRVNPKCNSLVDRAITLMTSINHETMTKCDENMPSLL